MERDEFRGGVAMTDKTKCQHCGADGDKFGSGILFECGSVNEHQSDLCEVRELRAKVAAQQELLKNCRNTLCVLGTAYALDLVDAIDAAR